MSHIDIHETLKREIFATEASGRAEDAHFEKQRPAPSAVHGGSNQYVVLDSWVKDGARSEPGVGRFSWNFMVQGVSQDQNVGVKDVIDTVTEIQIGAFTIPNFFPSQQMQNPILGMGGAVLRKVPGFPGLVSWFPTDVFPASAISATYGFFPYQGRVTIELVETGRQFISQAGAAAGIRYHFEADVIPVFATQGTLSTALGGNPLDTLNPIPVALRVVPLPGFDRYAFTDPLRDVHGLTVVFHSVDRNLPFPQDTLTGGVAFTDAAVYPFLAFAFPIAQKDYRNTILYLATTLGSIGGAGTQLMFSGLATGNAAVDAWVNQAPGLLGALPQQYAPGVALDRILTDLFSDTLLMGPQTEIRFTLAPAVDISALVPAAPAAGVVVEIPSATPVTVRFATARVRVPLMCRRIVPRLTAYDA